MFEIGFWEMVLVGVVAMIVVGPERLPGLARTAGMWLGKARRMVADVKAEVDRELHLEEIKQSLRQQVQLTDIDDIKKDLTSQVQAIERDIQAEFDDPGPPPGWRPGAVSAPPPPDWQPPVADSPASEIPPASPPPFEKGVLEKVPPPFENRGQGGLINLEKPASPPPPVVN